MQNTILEHMNSLLKSSFFYSVDPVKIFVLYISSVMKQVALGSFIVLMILVEAMNIT